MTLDKKLEPFRGRCFFKQYMPKKPARYGIKIHLLWLILEPPIFQHGNLLMLADGPYKKANSSCEIAKHIQPSLDNSGTNITTDNWYTSYELANFLQKNKISIVGKIHKDKKIIPPKFTSNKT
ncbi:uncharacterized protein LOC118194464 [Stegodyphus dumicola]|uniref:uncharacterized protein LOC118194464 n=1 Tax=Stegodyphus dumicola TaxID=202533 RepID=UPI0015A9E25D|nr:uncharacterized protein LOC118194464 [Stegodyphus dumicola]